MPTETPKEKFLRLCPGGFSDPLYLKHERNYKVAAHELWWELLNEEDFYHLLSEDKHKEICDRVKRVEAKTRTMLSPYEKSALRDGANKLHYQKIFTWSLYNLIYGENDFHKRFEEFSEDLASLPRNPSPVATWPIATMFSFLAYPKQHIFLKPKVSKLAAQHRNFALKYKSQPNWTTYSFFLRLAELIAHEVADLNPRDMIDIQSYIWVTEYWHVKS